ncbi:hypothetical protein NIES4074_57000 [Cylindrospermum sp. NIES-4074]|nr:hypothetical protein NIES4074_57000 [Cylindrospermum sp. NIES-4074]
MVRIISEVANSLEIAELRAEIFSKRNRGEVLYDIKQLIPDHNQEIAENQTVCIDLFITQLGCSPLGSRWKPINQTAAKKILTLIMTKDLAYGGEIMSLPVATALIVKLFNFFPGDRQFFTNASFENDYTSISTWDSITKATFDTGIIIVGNNRIGILWAKDED